MVPVSGGEETTETENKIRMSLPRIRQARYSHIIELYFFWRLMNPNDLDPKTVDEVAETCVKTTGTLVDRLGPFLGTLYKPRRSGSDGSRVRRKAREIEVTP